MSAARLPPDAPPAICNRVKDMDAETIAPFLALAMEVHKTLHTNAVLLTKELKTPTKLGEGENVITVNPKLARALPLLEKEVNDPNADLQMFLISVGAVAEEVASLVKTNTGFLRNKRVLKHVLTLGQTAVTKSRFPEVLTILVNRGNELQ